MVTYIRNLLDQIKKRGMASGVCEQDYGTSSRKNTHTHTGDGCDEMREERLYVVTLSKKARHYWPDVHCVRSSLQRRSGWTGRVKMAVGTPGDHSACITFTSSIHLHYCI